MSLDHLFEEPTAIRTNLGAIFVSLELSRSTWLCRSRRAAARNVEARRIRWEHHCDIELAARRVLLQPQHRLQQHERCSRRPGLRFAPSARS
jgi:hypothetical protein